MILENAWLNFLNNAVEDASDEEEVQLKVVYFAGVMKVIEILQCGANMEVLKEQGNKILKEIEDENN